MNATVRVDVYPGNGGWYSITASDGEAMEKILRDRGWTAAAVNAIATLDNCTMSEGEAYWYDLPWGAES